MARHWTLCDHGLNGHCCATICAFSTSKRRGDQCRFIAPYLAYRAALPVTIRAATLVIFLRLCGAEGRVDLAFPIRAVCGCVQHVPLTNPQQQRSEGLVPVRHG